MDRSNNHGGWLLMSESPMVVEGEPSTLLHGTTTEEELVRTHADNPGLVFDVYNSVQHNTQRRVLWALVQESGRVSYDELEPYMTVSQRSTRKHVSNLVDNDIINRIDANFTFIEFDSIAAEVLTKEALTRWYDKTR